MSTNPRLGRGLAALMGETQSPPVEGGLQIQAMPIDNLEPGPFQPRLAMAPEALSELVESIKARGILQPLLARRHPGVQGRYQIIAGERRWRAAQQAGLHEVPVLLRELGDGDAMAAALVENLQRQDLNAIEEADGYRRLIDEFGLTQEELGAAVGKSRSHVANCLRLLNLPASVRADVQAGRLSAGHARALLSHANPEIAARMVIERGLNVRQAEALVTNRAAPSPKDAGAQAKDPETVALERDLSERLGLRVDISFDGRGGQLRLNYKSLEQLDTVIALLSRVPA
jgi:ParB family chromosome partitioning protein